MLVQIYLDGAERPNENSLFNVLPKVMKATRRLSKDKKRNFVKPSLA